MNLPHADVAELADAQVSEACDGDIVEVQVLSSAPFLAQEASPQPQISYLGFAGSLFFPYFWNPSVTAAYNQSRSAFRVTEQGAAVSPK